MIRPIALKHTFTTIATLAILSSDCHAATGGNLSNCRGGCPGGEACVGNPFSQPVSDSECGGCGRGQYWWPCNFEVCKLSLPNIHWLIYLKYDTFHRFQTLCFCASTEEGAPRVPPAPASKLSVNQELDICADVLTEDVFNSIVQPTSDEGRALFSYSGLCIAIDNYNRWDDKVLVLIRGPLYVTQIPLGTMMRSLPKWGQKSKYEWNWHRF